MEEPEIPGLGEGQQAASGAEPGAIKWAPTGLSLTVPAGGRRYRLVSGQFSVICPYDGHLAAAGPLRVEEEDRGIVPPPVVPELVRFTGPATAKPGQTISLEVGLSVPAPLGGVFVEVQGLWLVGMTIHVPAGQSNGSTQRDVPAAYPEGPVSLTATYQGKVLPHLISIIKDTPIPPPPGPIPVTRTYDLTGASQSAIQAAIARAGPGDGIFLGPGLYLLNGATGADGQQIDILNKDGITLFGTGPNTVLDMGGKEGIWARQGGRIGAGNCVRDLKIQNCRRAVVALDPQRLWMQRVEVVGASHGYASERTGAYDNGMYEWPVTVEDVSVRGWSAHGMMLHGGETVRRCQLIDTPGNSGSTYSHGLYMQGCRNVLIEDLLIENVSGHAWQIYSDSATHAANGAENIVMRRVTCRNGRYGPIIAANGRYTGIVIEDLIVSGTVSRETGTFVISATNDWIEGLTMRGVTLDGGGEGLVLQGGQTGGIRQMMIDRMDVVNHSTGIVVAPSSWPYTRIESSIVRDYQAPGVPVPVRGSSPGLVFV